MSDAGIKTELEAGTAGGSERVFAFFREQLLSGALKPGDRLLGERELSLQLGVGRPLLREVLRSLAMLGFLDIQHGRGTFVSAPDLDVLGDFFTFALAQEGNVLDDVVNMRIAIECQAIRLACQRAHSNDLKRLGEKLKALTETLHDPDRGGLSDFEFHNTLVACSHSPSLMTVYRSISDLLMRSHVERRRDTVEVPAIIDDLVESHRQVFLSIMERDPDAAEARLREHFAIGDEIRRQNLIATYTRRTGDRTT
ncbi:FadR/GntR family transcriptional regulator [Pararhizobium haloflavum]|uniref:FadR/GntR family transcriptional regulator n=1 Tax=Pararhizobium haloflavum TaxID=2037914 RepID=UPI000C17C881|nr:FadR/GntR family transcriptional regulator [Pararhizobium haloflavum]